MASLTDAQRALLMLVLSHRRSPLLKAVVTGDPMRLPLSVRNDIRSEIGGDLADYGFFGTELNELGLALEDLIDALGHDLMTSRCLEEPAAKVTKVAEISHHSRVRWHIA